MRSEPCLTVHTFRRTGGARCQLLARPPPCVRWRLRAAHCALEDETPTTSDGRRISSNCVGVQWPACDCLFVAADSHLAPAAAEVDSPSSSCLAVLRQAVLVRFKVEMQRLHGCVSWRRTAVQKRATAALCHRFCNIFTLSHKKNAILPPE